MKYYAPVRLHFKFEDFANLRNGYVVSAPDADCNGHTWKLQLFHHGTPPYTGEEWIGLCFYCNNDDDVGTFNFELSVKNAKGETVMEDKTPVPNRFARGIFRQFMKRSEIFDVSNGHSILKDGALIVEVTVQTKEKLDELYDPQEKKAHRDKGLQLLKNQETADLSVTVDGQIFHVHSLILGNYAPILAAYCEQTDNNFGGISSGVFQMVLEYVYSGQRPDDSEILNHDKELIDASK